MRQAAPRSPSEHGGPEAQASARTARDRSLRRLLPLAPGLARGWRYGDGEGELWTYLG